MSRVSSSSSFRRSLGGFLGSASAGSAWVDRALQITRISRASRSLSTQPVSGIDAAFAAQDGFETRDPGAGLDAFSRTILASDVLDSLIRMQSEMSAMDADPAIANATTAIGAYQHALDGLAAL